MMTSKSPDSGSGIRSARTTGVFRALNFELFVKPVRSQFVTTLQNPRIVELITLATPIQIETSTCARYCPTWFFVGSCIKGYDLSFSC